MKGYLKFILFYGNFFLYCICGISFPFHRTQHAVAAAAAAAAKSLQSCPILCNPIDSSP